MKTDFVEIRVVKEEKPEEKQEETVEETPEEKEKRLHAERMAAYEEERLREKEANAAIKAEAKAERLERRKKAGWVDGRKIKPKHEFKLISIRKEDAETLDRMRVSFACGALSYADEIERILGETEMIRRQAIVAPWVASGRTGYMTTADDIESKKLIEVLVEHVKTKRSITSLLDKTPRPIRGQH